MDPTAARRTCVHLRVCLALLPSGPDAVRRLKLHRVRAAVRLTHSRALPSAEALSKPAVYFARTRQANSSSEESRGAKWTPPASQFSERPRIGVTLNS